MNQSLCDSSLRYLKTAAYFKVLFGGPDMPISLSIGLKYVFLFDVPYDWYAHCPLPTN